MTRFGYNDSFPGMPIYIRQFICPDFKKITAKNEQKNLIFDYQSDSDRCAWRPPPSGRATVQGRSLLYFPAPRQPPKRPDFVAKKMREGVSFFACSIEKATLVQQILRARLRLFEGVLFFAEDVQDRAAPIAWRGGLSGIGAAFADIG